MIERGIYALPCGVDFPRELVAGLIARMQDQPPEAMARVRLYLNSGRMLRRVREEFDLHGARFLPQLKLVTDLGRAPVRGLPPAEPALRRRLELAQLVAGLVDRLPGFEAGHGIFGLADSLATLMAEMQSEGVTPDDLEALEIADTHAQHWRLSLDFIRIVARYFEADATPDAEARQRRVVEQIIADWAEAGPTDPIIVAGSTGSRGATGLFMQAVARLPQGALVLPGFDFSMPAHAWNSLKSGTFPIEDHPQYRYRAMLDALEATPADVTRWHHRPEPSPERNALISLALRPAPVTDQWMQEGAHLPDLVAACEDLTLIEARDPRAEANAIALILREAAENGTSTALITPDRMLTRRVAVALDRWGIIPDDSAGQPLQQTAPGRLLRHLAAMRGEALTLDGLLILLKHPLTATGSTMRGTHLRYTRELELDLRKRGPAFPDHAALVAWAKRYDDKPDYLDKLTWANWLGAFFPLLEAPYEMPLGECVTHHLALAAHLATGPDGTVEASELWLQDGGREAFRVFSELAREAVHGGAYTRASYADLVNHLLQGSMTRAGLAAHRDITIFGALEARVQGAELVILAGLNEGSWPEAPDPDPWLSRQMRLQAGLLLPERQTGLSAHDFQQAVGAPRVVLTRARRDAEAETVPSRWVNRMVNLMSGLPDKRGPEALAKMRERGAKWLGLASSLDRPQGETKPARRPSPRPPVEARPKDLSVTQVKTLIRDPYAIYARKVLKLYPLNPLRPEPDPLLRGNVLHEIVERFVRQRPEDEDPALGEARLIAIAEDVLREEVPWPSVQRLWLARITKIARRFAVDEAARAKLGTPAIIEEKTGLPLPDLDFKLTAKPDRIDILENGLSRIYDYKSGSPPSAGEMIHFDKQMLLEAAMVTRGAFKQIGPREVEGMTYIRLGGEGETAHHTTTVEFKPRGGETQTETAEEAWAKFCKLVATYMKPAQGFTARRAMHGAQDRSDYDQLSRYGEWELSETPDGEDLT
ncbi:double-strand break repair protein AddB [Thioclava litoralis]|uniref:Double-strand break repair protein AddB n=1 Tax=Thioclava litoralis TaxID=3076557 RepID=A0ABZ1DWF9_9RHOB|nr:double-strand break repair protein AddB [Thioclava sp. FTW29]